MLLAILSALNSKIYFRKFMFSLHKINIVFYVCTRVGRNGHVVTCNPKNDLNIVSLSSYFGILLEFGLFILQLLRCGYFKKYVIFVVFFYLQKKDFLENRIWKTYDIYIGMEVLYSSTIQ